ncbi:phage tail terminator protein, partial [Escherichia coli]|nr:phage tail terminator protein [Escherichia coli]
FPAIAVYLTDAEYTGEELDADTWRATLHIEVFLPAQVPDAYHLAGIDMPDFEREDDWWRNGQNLYLDNMAVTGFYRVPL